MLGNIRSGGPHQVFWRALLPFAAGLLGSLALPPWHIWPALPVAFSLLAWVLDKVAYSEPAMARRCRAAALVGWCFGFGWFIYSLSWVTEAFRVDAAIFAWMIPFVITLLPAGLALFWAAATATVMRWWRSDASGILFLVAALSVAEWLRGHLFTGFPWNLPGYVAGASDSLAQTASVIGIYGLTTLVLLWSMLPVMLWRPGGTPSYRLAGLSIAAFALCWGVGGWRLAAVGPGSHDDITVSIVQASIPQSIKWQRQRRADILSRYLELTAKASANDVPGHHIFVWPETALPYLVAELPALRHRVAAELPLDSFLVLGAIRREPAVTASGTLVRVFNSILVIDRNGDVTATYDKHRLVPFGEFLPFDGILGPLGLRKLVPVPLSFSAGKTTTPISIAGLPSFIPLVCYEAIFPLTMPASGVRAKWIVNVTNDAWFGSSAGPVQHLEQARFRAIEDGLPLVRAANTGISAIIDARGKVLKRFDAGAVGILTAPLPRPVNITFYGRFGDLFYALLVAGLLGAAVAAARKLHPSRS